MNYKDFGFIHYMSIALAIFGGAAAGNRARQEEICQTMGFHSPLTQIIVGPGQTCNELTRTGRITCVPEENDLYLVQKMYRGLRLNGRRNEFEVETQRMEGEFNRKIAKALIEDNIVVPKNSELAEIIAYHRLWLSYKFQAYYSALQSQNGYQYGNCMDHSQLMLAAYLKEQLDTGETFQLQRFILKSHLESHSFTVINSGVKGQIIGNNPDQVEAVMKQVDDAADNAYLCDENFNRESGSFAEVRARNAMYQSPYWKSLYILNMDTTFNVDDLPEEAVSLRIILEDINDTINEMIKQNIKIPESMLGSFEELFTPKTCPTSPSV